MKGLNPLMNTMPLVGTNIEVRTSKYITKGKFIEMLPANCTLSDGVLLKYYKIKDKRTKQYKMYKKAIGFNRIVIQTSPEEYAIISCTHSSSWGYLPKEMKTKKVKTI